MHSIPKLTEETVFSSEFFWDEETFLRWIEFISRNVQTDETEIFVEQLMTDLQVQKSIFETFFLNLKHVTVPKNKHEKLISLSAAIVDSLVKFSVQFLIFYYGKLPA